MLSRQLAQRAVVVAVVVLTGCANMESHDKLATQVQAANTAGGPAAALKQLEASATTDDARKALLFNLERGELLRQNRQYKDSTAAWLVADAKVNEWENTAKTDPNKLFGMVGATLISERLKPYEGQDYEKVWLTTRLALNRIAENDWDNARVDIKRTHEREAVIAELRSKETLAAEQEAKAKGAQVTNKEINGYPVESLNDPEVLKLKNGYQNALSHYLAGFLYEVLNEGGLAAPGYRKAIELKPDTPVLMEGLRGLDDRTSFTHRRKQRMTDVLFVLESGTAPARKPRNFTIPVPVAGRLNSVSISYPVIEPSVQPGPSRLTLGDVTLQPAVVADLNVMARRALKDEMPGMMMRGVVRAVAKGVVQNELNKAAGPLGGLIGAAAAIATEQADDRIWRTLPGVVSVARGYLPAGEHRLLVDGRDTGQVVTVAGQYMLVPVQLLGAAVTVGQATSFGQLAAGAPAAAPSAATSVPSNLVTPASTAAPAKPAARPAAKPAAQPAAPKPTAKPAAATGAVTKP
ncbi:COG3014 family protein [Pseudaquabacterium pictum]|uniref:Lipoprotein n=1 Tax=Pseudaquabacterium pictum TaxID=2315236 RepID=A0A480AHL1_9BURK|nr:hypothetical protein [Rubrivivax pictus]GCL61131.1 hypothetical protein AQPW35_02120 [Rubrivivax pictus]